jgi:hypothetical protein
MTVRLYCVYHVPLSAAMPTPAIGITNPASDAAAAIAPVVVVGLGEVVSECDNKRKADNAHRKNTLGCAELCGGVKSHQ